MQTAPLTLANHSWAWFLMPMNASASGVSTIIPIYILALGGQIREVAIAIFLSNLALTLGAIFWGRIIDSLHWRSTIILICSAAIAVASASMYFVSSIPFLMFLSALVGFFSVGPAPVANLLVMEKSRKDEWLKTYTWTSLVSAAGLVIAMLAGYVWLLQYEARSYAIACSAIAISSMALTMIFVKDPPAPIRKRSVIRLPALTRWLKQVPTLLQKPVPKLSPAKLRQSVSKKEFLFFAGTGLFFLSGSVLYTAYTPFLKDSGISDSDVFLAYTVLHLSRVLFLPFNNRIIARRGEENMGRIAYIPRIAGLALAVGAALLLSGNPTSVLMISLLAFIALEVGFSIWSTTTTSSLLRFIPGGKEGSILGINSAIIGAGLLLGSIAAGEVTNAFGYGTTFAVAIGFALASLVLVSKFFKKTVPVAVATPSRSL